MQLRNHFVLPVMAVLGLSFLVGCGSSVNKPVAPPSGGFTNANLKGTYVFSIVGADNVSGTFLATTGTFTASGTGGSGGITGGAIDMNDASFSAPLRNNPITGGNYTVTTDGRGRATLLTSTPFGSSLVIDFVLSSSEHGMVTEFDGNGSGSGTLDLQTATSQPAAGSYVFGLSGISGINVVTGFGTPLGTAGLITLDGSGNATGSLDYNNNETPSQLTINSGSNVLVSGTPGTATLVTSGGVTLNFDVYAIDATHMKFIEVDPFPILSGDVFSQTSASFPSGQIVFTMAGLDFTAAAPLAVGGLMTSNGTSTISNGEEDFNDAGSADTTPQSFAGTISSSGGRTVLQLTNFENGAGGAVGTFTFAAYPSSGGIQLLEIDPAGVTAGVAFAQSATSLASSQGYGFNLTAANSGNFEEDDIAEFVTTSNSFSGLMDINDQGQQTSFAQKLNGSYSLDSPATGRGVLSGNLVSGAFYVVDNSNVLFLETDATQLGIGAFSLQAATAQSNLAATHLAMLRSRSAAKAAWHRRK